MALFASQKKKKSLGASHAYEGVATCAVFTAVQGIWEAWLPGALT